MSAQPEQPIKKKHPGGRPTKYTPELIRKTKEYLDTYEEKGDAIPSIAGMAQELELTRETIHTWTKDKNKKQFSDIIKALSYAQERKLLTGGLNSTMNPTITKLILSRHGYHDNPQANQASTGIQVTVNRGIVKLETGGQTLTVDASEQVVEGETLEHKP